MIEVTVEEDDVYRGNEWIMSRREWEALSEEERNIILFQPHKVVPHVYRHAKLSDFEGGTARQQASGTIASLFAKRWKEARSGLYIYGGVGVGKTHLLAATVAASCARGADCIWWTEDHFFDDIWQDYREKKDLWGVTERKDVVAFDDLFQFGRWSDWKREQVDRLIHRIYLGHSKLLITSNVGWSELHAGITGVEASTLSRLKEMVFPLKMDGADRRERPRRSNES